MIDIAREAKKQGLRSVLISCGIMNEAPLAELCETLDAIKIDLKGYDEAFYRDVCGAELKPVLRSIKQIARSRAHLEIVNLVVPTLNDSEKMLRGLIDWVLGEIGPDVPVHFTRFHPGLPAPEPAAHAGRDAGAGPGDGDGPGDALRLCGKRPGPSGEPYLLPFLREGGHQTHRILHRGNARKKRPLRLLPRKIAGVWS